MTKKVKCRQCGQQIDRDNAIKMANGYYVCSEKCEEQWQDEHKPKAKQAADDRKQLLERIKSVAPNANMRLISIQLALLMKDNPDMTYGGIWYTMIYLQNNGYDLTKSPLGLVKYKYDESRKHYEWQIQMKQQVSTWQQDDAEVEIIKKDMEDEVFD